MCYIVYYGVPFRSQMIFEGTLLLIIIIFNTWICWIFLKKKNRNHVTLLLAFLGITDSVTSICSTIPKLVGYAFYFDDFRNNTESVFDGWFWKRRYPSCIPLVIIEDCIHVFHASSVLITTILCVQKSVVMAFPFRSKVYCTMQTSLIAIMMTLVTTLAIYLPSTVHGVNNMYKGENDTCCISSEHMYIVNIHAAFGSNVNVSIPRTQTQNIHPFPSMIG